MQSWQHYHINDFCGQSVVGQQKVYLVIPNYRNNDNFVSFAPIKPLNSIH